MPLKVITPATPCYLMGLRPRRSEAYTDFFWIAYTTDLPQTYIERAVETARQDGVGSAALKVAIKDVLARGDSVWFDLLDEGIPYARIAEEKQSAIAYYREQGHALCNSEVRKMERAEQRAERDALRAAEREKACLLAEERQKEILKYRWPEAPEGCVNIYVEEEWEDGMFARAVRVGSTKDSAAKVNRSIGSSVLFQPYSPQAKRVREQKARGVQRRLRRLEVHPRAGLKARKDAWAEHLGLR